MDVGVVLRRPIESTALIRHVTFASIETIRPSSGTLIAVEQRHWMGRTLVSLQFSTAPEGMLGTSGGFFRIPGQVREDL